MNILFQFSVSGSELDQASNRPSAIALKEKMSWLLEWEHAQREAQGRPHENTTTVESPGDSIRHEQRPIASVGETISPLLSADKGGIGTKISEITLYRSVEKMHTQPVFRAGLQSQLPIPSMPVAITAEPAPLVPVMGPAKSASDHRVTRLWELLNASEWRPFLVNITRTENGIRVWIRDPRNQAHLWLDAVSVLRREFLKTGLVLDSLALNGSIIWGKSFDDSDVLTTHGGIDERDVDTNLNRIF